MPGPFSGLLGSTLSFAFLGRPRRFCAFSSSLISSRDFSQGGFSSFPNKSRNASSPCLGEPSSTAGPSAVFSPAARASVRSMTFPDGAAGVFSSCGASGPGCSGAGCSGVGEPPGSAGPGDSGTCCSSRPVFSLSSAIHKTSFFEMKKGQTTRPGHLKKISPFPFQNI